MTTSAPSKSKAFLVEASLPRQFGTVAVAAVGGLIFQWLNIPAGAMSGAMIATAGVSSLLPGTVVPLGGALRRIAMVVSGIGIGASVTRDVLANVVTYPASIVTMMLCVVVMTATSAIITIVFAHWDRATAVLAAVPGALAYILSVLPTTKASSTRVVAVQMMRVFFLVALVPVIVAESGIHLTVMARPEDSWWVFAIECLLGAGAGWILTKLRMAGGMLLGAMLVSGTIHALEFAHGRAPWSVMIAGQILIGAWSGSRFVGFDWNLFWRQSPSILGSIVASLLIAGAFAFGASQFITVPFGAIFLAFSPGGFEAMAVLALALGFDPFYVAAHHLSRFFFLNFGLPLSLNAIVGKDGRKK